MNRDVDKSEFLLLQFSYLLPILSSSIILTSRCHRLVTSPSLRSPPSPVLDLSVRGLIAPVVRNQTHHQDVNLAHCNCKVKRQIGELATRSQGPVQFCLKRTLGQQVVHSVIVLSVSTRKLRCPSVLVLSVSTR
jgi:hypothetical protein